MRLYENFALSCRMTAFLLLKLPYGQIMDANEMLQLVTVCLSTGFFITPLIASEEGDVNPRRKLYGLCSRVLASSSVDFQWTRVVEE